MMRGKRVGAEVALRAYLPSLLFARVRVSGFQTKQSPAYAGLCFQLPRAVVTAAG